MPTSVLALLVIFYAGAVIATGWSWAGVCRGRVGFSALRDLTGISDRAVLRRLFGLARADGTYQIRFADVIRHRRRPGIILTDLPVHGLFLAALSWATLMGGPSVALAVTCAAAAHVVVVTGAAVAILARSRHALLD